MLWQAHFSNMEARLSDFNLKKGKNPISVAARLVRRARFMALRDVQQRGRHSVIAPVRIDLQPEHVLKRRCRFIVNVARMFGRLCLNLWPRSEPSGRP